jgi:hypothetical protein
VAVMAKINPFFEHAGMQPIAESHPSKPVAQTLQTLEELGFEPALLPNVAYVENRINQVGAQKITALLLQLSQKDGAARKRLATARNPFPKHEEVAAKIQNQTPSQLAQTLKRLSFLAQSKLYLFWRKPEETLN